ncbi:hypothetical protein [Shewanella baltica]|uniref:hypothetical protein n=1 Tax=Shewanella baltica TaxID=62322 RepID=UPI0024B93CA1|nr:hypothetical protein [Shewanella baltica]
MVIGETTVRTMDGAVEHPRTCCVSVSEHHGKSALVDISQRIHGVSVNESGCHNLPNAITHL